MPGKKGYGPGGKWIHDRAHRILRSTKKQYGEEEGKRVAYAMATLQAHKLKKTPKRRFGTSFGKAEAKALYRKPTKAYKKTAAAMEKIMMAAFFDELRKLGW